MNLILDSLDTPIGEMTAVFSGNALCYLDFSDCPDRLAGILKKRFPMREMKSKTNPGCIRDKVSAYFKGDVNAFEGVKLDTGGTVFQQSVWRALMKIPHGRTISYSELAENVNNPKAVRAVGSANGQNPIAIIIPCHRVIASTGALAGYAGGIERKQKLLELEGAL